MAVGSSVPGGEGGQTCCVGAGRDPGTSPATKVKQLYSPLWQAGNVKEDRTCKMPDIV